MRVSSFVLAIAPLFFSSRASAQDDSAFAAWVPSREGPNGPALLSQQDNSFQRRQALPSHDEIDRALSSVGLDTSFFWTGMSTPCQDHERDGVIGRAERTAQKYHGATLEMRLRAAGVNMPPWNGGDDAKALWTYASAKFAANTKGNAHVILGDCVRDHNTLVDVEIPRLQDGGQVACIIRYRAREDFMVPSVYWRRDQNDWCDNQVEWLKVAIACLSYDAAGWRRRLDRNINAFGAYTGRDNKPTYRYGGLYAGTPFQFMMNIDDDGGPKDGQNYMKEVLKQDTLIHAWFSSDRSRRPDILDWFGGTVYYQDACLYSVGGSSSRKSKRDISGKNLRILPLGDSITWGYKSSDGNGYRQYLMDLLDGNTVDYVGSQLSGNMGNSQNEGHPGYEINQMFQYIYDDVQMKPNVVLLLIGTNDINNNDDTDTAPDRLYSLLSQLTQSLPDAAIIVSEIPSITDDAAEDRAITYNGRLEEVAMEFQNDGHKVMPISMDLLTNDNLVDGLHPTDDGYSFMAGEWYQGILQVNELGWIKDPEPASTGSGSGHKSLCSHNPNWLPQGQVATGASLGRNGGLYNCVDKPDDRSNTQCNCGAFNNYPSGSDAVVNKPPNGQCSDLNDNSTAVHFADLNGDGRDDYLYVDPHGAVTAFLNAGQAPDNGPNAGKVQWFPQGVIATGVGAKRSQIRFADLNGDGRAEYLYVHDDSSVEAWLNLGGPAGDPGSAGKVGWLPQGIIASGIGKDGAGVRFADINGDGRAEYLWVDEKSGAVTAFVNAGGPDNGPNAAKVSWIPNDVIASGVAPRSQIQFADLNGDGRADYLIVDPTSGAVTEYLNAGQAPDNGPNAAKVVWYPQGTIATGVGTNGLGITFGDLNGDGRAEYLDVNPLSSGVNAWLNGC